MPSTSRIATTAALSAALFGGCEERPANPLDSSTNMPKAYEASLKSSYTDPSDRLERIRKGDYSALRPVGDQKSDSTALHYAMNQAALGTSGIYVALMESAR